MAGEEAQLAHDLSPGQGDDQHWYARADGEGQDQQVAGKVGLLTDDLNQHGGQDRPCAGCPHQSDQRADHDAAEQPLAAARRQVIAVIGCALRQRAELLRQFRRQQHQPEQREQYQRNVLDDIEIDAQRLHDLARNQRKRAERQHEADDDAVRPALAALDRGRQHQRQYRQDAGRDDQRQTFEKCQSDIDNHVPMPLQR